MSEIFQAFLYALPGAIAFIASVLTIYGFLKNSPRSKNIDEYRTICENLSQMTFSDPNEEILKGLYVESANLKIDERYINRIGRISIWETEAIAYFGVAFFPRGHRIAGFLLCCTTMPDCRLIEA